jgi:hypothetical protein
MTSNFDPYLKWLGIRPQDQPANHYRLLGIDLFMDDPEVIEHAADRQMLHVRTFQAGKHADISQKILNEIATAKLCLLTAHKKATYDQSLRLTRTPEVRPPRPLPITPASTPPDAIQITPVVSVVLPTTSSSPRPAPQLPVLLIACGAIGVLTIAGLIGALILSQRGSGKVANRLPGASSEDLPSSSRDLFASTRELDVDSVRDEEGWIDLLALVDVSKNTVQGNWSIDNGSLRCQDPNAAARIILPVTVTGDYHLRVIFTQVSAASSLRGANILFSVGARRQKLALDGFGRHISGLGNINHRTAAWNETKTDELVLVNDQRYTVDLRVNVLGTTGYVEAHVDDKPLVRWSGPIASLSLPDGESLGNSSLLGLSIWHGTYLFHEARLKIIDGEATLLRDSTR